MRIVMSGMFLDQPNTGTGRYSLEVLRHLAMDDGDRFRVVVMTDEAEAAARAIAREVLADVEVVRADPLVGGNAGKVWFEQVSLPRAAGEAAADVLFVPYFGSPHRSKLPVVTTIHDLIMLVVPEHLGDWRVRGYTEVAAAAARRSRRILADSNATRDDVVRLLGIGPERIDTIYLAADERFRPATPEAIVALRQRFQLPETPAVLYLGGYDARKDVPALIEAFSRLEPPADLWLAGRIPEPGGLFPDVRAAIAASGVPGRIRLLGYVEEADKPALYSAATMVVYPSRYEGFGLPVLEAMACGAAVVSSNASSLPEVYGDAAVAVSPGDLDALSGAIARLLGDPAERARLGQRGIERAAGFSWERCADHTREALRVAVG
jgi:glycosyltransferase involved in cell wall biosynthesis